MALSSNRKEYGRVAAADVRPARLSLGRLALGGLVAAIGAAVANLIVFFVARDGLDVSMMGRFQGGDLEELEPALVAAMSAVPALLAAGFLWVLSRFVRRPLLVFQVIAVVALLLSIVGPLTIEDVSTGTRVAMVVMHVVAAAVIVGVLSAVAQRERPDVAA